MKKELRKKFITERNTLSENYRISASKKIFEALEKHEAFLQAEKIFIFVGFDTEIQTEILIKKWINKKKLFVPKIENNTMHLIQITSWDDLERGNFGILEPKYSNYYTGKIDLVITPSIVFDRNGYRLGYGKGYYDKYFSLSNYNFSIGLSYDKLLQETIPIDSHDKAVDIIITEEEILVTNEKYNSNNLRKDD
ncbi:5-formyltetrahydrofolate cyclo-ligase [uncultured Gemella sp.]|uniref:5-formyltetrahydrofolate cyclo-ligase n=1 Tax=uncultured Gemella sp. TaxID=254352 RepID=UPI0028D843AB|nr:5-formyltetrahydrofolate cyclo-ligase [uncultured Gemella sp.]